MGLLQEILTERENVTIGDSSVIDVLDKNTRLTTKSRGPVFVGILRRKQLQVSLLVDPSDVRGSDSSDLIVASIGPKKVWTVKNGKGIGKISLKKISDDEMRAVVQKIFDKAKKQK